MFDYDNEPEEIIEDDPMDRSDDMRDMKNECVGNELIIKIDPIESQEMIDRYFRIGKFKEG